MSHPWENHDDSCECHIGICMDCGCTNEYVPSPDTERAPPARQHGPNDGCGELLWEHMSAEPGFDEEIRQAKAELAEGRGVPLCLAQTGPPPLDVERLAQAMVESGLMKQFLDYAIAAHRSTMFRKDTPADLAYYWARPIAESYARLSPTQEEGAG